MIIEKIANAIVKKPNLTAFICLPPLVASRATVEVKGNLSTSATGRFLTLPRPTSSGDFGVGSGRGMLTPDPRFGRTFR